MKAKKIETPTSSLLVLLLIALIMWAGFDSIYAVENIQPNNTVDTIGAFDEAIKNEEQRTTFDIQADIEAGAVQKNKEKALALKALQEQQEREAAALAAKEAAIAAEEARYTSVDVCGYLSSKKTYMDYRAIHPSSAQMYIINTYTNLNDDGLLTTTDGFIAVALGSTYGELGSKYRVTTDTGKVFKVIKVDEKSDAHTTNGCQDSSGAIIEFVIDINRVNAAYPQVTRDGDLNALDQFNGNIVKIEKYV
ncbi:hypothetical protein M2475_002240 [Breznakia sp. PF5-3]|uniref:hypothetical protein n=1 Tax=unclassified Breznakia TaxID=2623764 RepID=UPI002406A639|nr:MULTISPECIES: hypothetical protein [unclassified Breznakia]MDF9825849.1 hypothetical protein [Breznakia sp. PM6-1]MDF9836658.1 hypothetical protein [Breznakia sp. PF5-3]MDF9838153.1 hypothetical protein [Breznakia sp. PFB2-8]MDF9860139.1 hypothetical protein [Breznakia sp. PH5-24]